MHRRQTHLLVLEFVDVAHADQRLKVGEGDGTPAAVAVAATGAEVGIFGGQRGRLDPVDRVCIRVLGRDGAAALALADQRALQKSAKVSPPRASVRWHALLATHRDLGLKLAGELLQLGKFLVVIHPYVGAAAVVASAVAGGLARLLLVVLVMIAGGKSRRADWELPVRGVDGGVDNTSALEACVRIAMVKAVGEHRRSVGLAVAVFVCSAGWTAGWCGAPLSFLSPPPAW